MQSFKRLFLAALALILAATAVVVAPASAAPKNDNPGQSKKAAKAIKWKPCYTDIQEGLWPDEFADAFGGPVRFECSQVNVPLDYDGSDGGTIQLAVIRIPAADQANKTGSLFTNPGGPSGSGVEFTLFSAPFAFSPEIRGNFDIVGFDPRGILLSTPARCFGNYKKILPQLPNLPYPVGEDQIATWLEADETFQSACAQRGNKILDHMSTANVARDMDFLREAVGDDQLTYVGYSYGTMVGATYANLFPENVRALALDSALDPIAWTTGYGNEAETIPVSSRLNSEGGAQDSLDHFFELCDAAGPNACPIAPDSAARYAAVHAALEAEPLVQTIEFIDFETGELIVQEVTFTAADLVSQTLGILYGGDMWPIISFIVADLEAQLFAPAPPPELGAQFARDIRALRAGEANSFVGRSGAWQGSLAGGAGSAYLPTKGEPKYFNFLEGFPGVLCSDSDNPSDINAWPAAADALDETSYFGSGWTWGSSVCNGWPGVDEDRYTGPWDAVTANPVLVINNEFDPATPLSGAIALDGLLGNSQLLVVDGGRGHIAAQSSICAAIATEQYLLTQQLPPADLVCEPNLADPFDGGFGPPPNITIILEGPDGPEGDPVVVETLTVNGQVVQPPLILDGLDGEIIVIEPVIVPLGTGETVTVETAQGPATFPPFDIPGEDGELVTVQANVIRDAVILDVITEGGGPIEPPTEPPPLVEAIVILPNGEETTVALIETPDGPVALDPLTGEALNIDAETGAILPIEIIEILGPFEPPAEEPPAEEPPVDVIVP